jgi:hypothetical protein
MAIQDLPTDKHLAIEFAESEFRNGTSFWPRLLVRCLEATEEGNGLAVVHRAYARRCKAETDITTESLLRELQTSVDKSANTEGDRLRARAREIWNDARCRSLLCRGVTRLFGAVASLLERDLDGYEIELTRALTMLTASGSAEADRHEFALIMEVFQEAFERSSAL